MKGDRFDYQLRAEGSDALYEWTQRYPLHPLHDTICGMLSLESTHCHDRPNVDVKVWERTIRVGLWYPRYDEKQNYNTIEVFLSDVRAADAIRIVYDFKRDGWSILQDSHFEVPGGSIASEDWQEVAFAKSWQRTATEIPERAWGELSPDPSTIQIVDAPDGKDESSVD